jgi:hypothetical protein
VTKCLGLQSQYSFSEEYASEIFIDVCLFIKYMLMSRHHNVGENLNMKITNRPFEYVANLKYSVKTVTDRNLIHEQIETDYIRVMLATILFRNICLFVCCIKT